MKKILKWTAGILGVCLVTTITALSVLKFTLNNDHVHEDNFYNNAIEQELTEEESEYYNKNGIFDNEDELESEEIEDENTKNDPIFNDGREK